MVGGSACELKVSCKKQVNALFLTPVAKLNGIRQMLQLYTSGFCSECVKHYSLCESEDGLKFFSFIKKFGSWKIIVYIDF